MSDERVKVKKKKQADKVRPADMSTSDKSADAREGDKSAL
jgi:hypothetical protein